MPWFVIRPSENDILHFGILNMHWGIRRFQNKDGSLTPAGRERYQKGGLTKSKDPESLSTYMKENVSYSEYTTLKSPEEVVKTKSGSCHDQVMLELNELKKLGLNPKAAFLMEYDPKTNQGGMTHSFAYYSKNGKSYWLENAWGGREGLHEYDSEDQMLKDALRRFKNESTMPNTIMTDFGKHEPGESLQELVDIALDNEELIKK